MSGWLGVHAGSVQMGAPHRPTPVLRQGRNLGQSALLGRVMGPNAQQKGAKAPGCEAAHSRMRRPPGCR